MIKHRIQSQSARNQQLNKVGGRETQYTFEALINLRLANTAH
jgi:hypothetical protein